MTKALRILIAILFVPAVASAQWTYQGVFPDSTLFPNGIHGLAVDGEDKVWVGPYSSTLFPATESTLPRRENFVRVFNSNGTEASFSPIIGAMDADTLRRFGPITGLSTDNMGNIWVSSDGYRVNLKSKVNPAQDSIIGGVWARNRVWVYKFSPAGVLLQARDVTFMRTETIAQSPNRVAVTADGDFAVSFVFPASPIVLYSGTDMSLIATVTNDKIGFSRTFEISADGNTIYNPSDRFYVSKYVSDAGVFGTYTLSPDTTLAMGMDPGSAHRYTVGTDPILYVAASGSGNNPVARAPWNNTRIYGISVASGNVVDSLAWDYGSRTAFAIPRAMAISADGLTMYLGTFSTGTPAIQKFTRATAASVERDDVRADGFALSQNYPNPFNPSTSISFVLPEAGLTTLKVYDMLGREVATLANGVFAQGEHSVRFDAGNLSSGVYLYELRSGNTRITNKMTLMK